MKRLQVAALAALVAALCGCAASGERSCAVNGAEAPAAQALEATERASSLPPLKVGVFADKGPGGIGAIEWFRIVQESPDMELTLLDGAAVRAGGLDGLDVFVMPGGASQTEFRSLGTNGVERMKAFVRNGGGYIGTCAGCCLLMDGPVNRARMMPWLSKASEGHTLFLNFKLNEKGAKAMGLKPGDHTMRFHGGPFLRPTTNVIEGANIESWGVFDAEATVKGRLDKKKGMYGATALVGGTYGKGRVFATSAHPEYFDSTLYIVRGAFRYVTGREVRFPKRLRRPGAISVGFIAKGISGVETAETALAFAAAKDMDLVLIDMDGIFQRRLDHIDALVVTSDAPKNNKTLAAAIADFAARGGKVVGYGTGREALPPGGVECGSREEAVKAVRALFR